MAHKILWISHPEIKVRTYKVTQIEWDTDGRKVTGLPKTVIVKTYWAPGDEDPRDGAIADLLSDTYGWCVVGCLAEEVM